MIKMNRLFMKYAYLALALIATLGLTGCSSQNVNPDEVLSSMNQSMSGMEQVKVSGQFDLIGSTGQNIFEDLSDLSINLQGEFNLVDISNFKYTNNLTVEGEGEEGHTRLGAEIKSFPDYNYFRITDISIPLGLPFSLTSDNRWYKVRKNNSGEEALGSGPHALTDTESHNLRQLIAGTNFFDPIEVFSDATVNGFRSYHLSAVINQANLADFITNLAQVTNDKIKVDQSVIEVLANHKYDLWITKRDFRLTKLKVTGVYVSDDYGQINFDVELNLNNFDTPLDITIPSSENVQDFQLDSLFGLPLANL